MKKSFSNYAHNKINLRFLNGNQISTIWGTSTYSDNHGYTSDNIDEAWGYEKFMDSNTCEVMITCGEKLYKKLHKKYGGSNGIIGYLTIDQWLDIVNKISKEKK